MCSYFMVREIEGIKMNWQTKDRMNRKKAGKEKKKSCEKKKGKRKEL